MVVCKVGGFEVLSARLALLANVPKELLNSEIRDFRKAGFSGAQRPYRD